MLCATGARAVRTFRLPRQVPPHRGLASGEVGSVCAPHSGQRTTQGLGGTQGERPRSLLGMPKTPLSTPQPRTTRRNALTVAQRSASRNAPRQRQLALRGEEDLPHGYEVEGGIGELDHGSYASVHVCVYTPSPRISWCTELTFPLQHSCVGGGPPPPREGPGSSPALRAPRPGGCSRGGNPRG